jgi:hypothetical protein
MLYACLCTICFVFCYTSWRFYAFSGTNLLTRCYSASSLFSVVLCFKKVTQEIFSELDETKAEVPIFPDTKWSPKQRRRGASRQPHHRVARPTPGPRHQVVRPPGPPPNAALPPIYSPRRENPKARSIFQKTYYKPPPSLTRDREGPEALPGTLPERGITTGGLFHHHACLRSDVWVVYLGLQVHGSS